MTGGLIVHRIVTGHLTLFEAAELRGELNALLAGRPSAIILDLSWVERIDSACLGVLVGLAKRAGAECRVLLAAPPRAVRTILELTRIDQFLRVAASMPEAILAATSGHEAQMQAAG